jgi:hypothetical protein
MKIEGTPNEIVKLIEIAMKSKPYEDDKNRLVVGNSFGEVADSYRALRNVHLKKEAKTHDDAH